MLRIFGNSPSPAMAILKKMKRKTANEAEEKYSKDMEKFVYFDCYVNGT